jgi:peroxiredoxin
VHCVNQLKAFETIAPEFKKLGIAIIALSPDTLQDLPKAQKYAASKQGFPFPLVAAKSMETFRAYRAFDDFEQLPLHAAALVDSSQHLRWLDVSYKPFMEAKFLLDESQRLLGLPGVQVAKK